jgi:hypothetical protein
MRSPAMANEKVTNSRLTIIFGIWFSFAIAGLLIDFMWVSTYVVIRTLGDNIKNPKSKDVAFNQLLTPPLGFVNEFYNYRHPDGKSEDPGGVTRIAYDSAWGVEKIMQSLMGRVKPDDKGSIFLVTGIINLFTGDWIKDGLISFLSWIGGVIAFIIIAVAIVWSLFRLGFELLKSYVYILIDVILGPFMIVAGVLPGSPIGFGMWVRDILSHLSVFPVTIAMFMLGKIFMESFAPDTKVPNVDVFVPPLIGNPSGTGNLAPLGALLGLGIILMTPQVVAMMKDLFKAPDFKYTGAVGQALGGAAGLFAEPIKPVISGVSWLAGQRVAGKIFPWLGKPTH